MPSGKGPLRVAIEDFVKTYSVPDELKAKLRGGTLKVEQNGINGLTRMMSRAGMPADMQQALLSKVGHVEGSEDPISLLAIAGMVLMFIAGLMMGLLQPVIRFFTYTGNQLIPNMRFDPITATRAMFRGVFSPAQWFDTLRAHGHSNENIVALEQVTRPRLSENEAILALWRGRMSEVEFRDYLEKKGWTPDDINRWREFGNSIPPLSDVIRFMVRDAFDQRVVDQYGYDENYPKETVERFAALNGYAPEIALYYWRAHWNLPSPTQAYEMLHRGQLTIDEAKTLLRIADYPPYWRDKLIAVAYEPYHRIDIRRMFEMKVLSYDEMVKAHVELGYPEDKARKMADFVVKLTAEKDKDLNRGDILAAYRDHAFTRDQTLAELEKLGYDARESDILIKRVDAALQQERVNEEIEFIHQEFLANMLDESAVRSKLAALQVSSVRIDTLVLKWKRDKEVKPRIPTRNDAEVFAKKGIITTGEYQDFLGFLGYPPKYIDWYVREVTAAKA